jgi:GTP-binding protein
MAEVFRDHLRNIAIIAHVDHGKTTLVDALLRQSGIFRHNEQVIERVMDSSDLERERGITILSKNTAVRYGDTKINIVDTPGHADFGGEVERVLRMVDGALLLVDAFEGPMAQTKFVLRKALQVGLKIIVVINKIDRPDARLEAVLDEVFDLFVELDAADWQLDFPVVYSDARRGVAVVNPEEQADNLKALFELIIKEVPPPFGDPDGVLQLQVNTLDYDDYVGRIAIGRVKNGYLKAGSHIALCREKGRVDQVKVTGLWTYEGLKRIEAAEAETGDIVAVAGLGQVNIGETLSDASNPQPLPLVMIDEPTITMNFIVNDSPFAGREGDKITSRQLRARLWKEAETNVSLKVSETESADTFEVSGRGELHLGILIETMRREGYEMQVSRPKPILKTIRGKLCEPFERLFLIIPADYQGKVIENMGRRLGEMQDLQQGNGGSMKLEFIIPARGLIGFRSELLTDTRGEGIMHHLFSHYGPRKGDLPRRRRGALVAFESGEATAYGIYNLQDRGQFFIKPGAKVYTGMIVGEHNRENDLDINVCKKKHLTNIRSSSADEAIQLAPPIAFSLESALEHIEDDELAEVTPVAIRLRKRFLDRNQRR